MKDKWYRHFNIIAAIFIFIGGVGLNTSTAMPAAFYIAVLAIGVITYAIFLFMITKERRGG